MARPKLANPTKKINISSRIEDIEVVNYILKPMGISMSSFLNDYLHAVAEAIRACGLTQSTFKDFTVGELQQTFETLQILLAEKKKELSELQQTMLPGIGKKD